MKQVFEDTSVKDFAFRARHLSVWNGARWVLENVSLSIPRGSFCVVLGPNGAGKSTLLASLSGVLTQPWCVYQEGVLCVPQKRGVRVREVHWLGQSLVYSEDMTVREFLNLPSVHSVEDRRREGCWSLFGADELLDARISTLSGGQWQRVRLSRALAVDASVLVMDEPDAALDARWRQVLWSTLRDRVVSGITVLVALHRFTEVQNDVTHWLGVEDGRVVFSESARCGFPQAYVDRLFSEKSLTR